MSTPSQKRGAMVEYVCMHCDACFEMYKYAPETRCPECLDWTAVPVDEYEEGTPIAPWGEEAYVG